MRSLYKMSLFKNLPLQTEINQGMIKQKPQRSKELCPQFQLHLCLSAYDLLLRERGRGRTVSSTRHCQALGCAFEF